MVKHLFKVKSYLINICIYINIFLKNFSSVIFKRNKTNSKGVGSNTFLLSFREGNIVWVVAFRNLPHPSKTSCPTPGHQKWPIIGNLWKTPTWINVYFDLCIFVSFFLSFLYFPWYFLYTFLYLDDCFLSLLRALSEHPTIGFEWVILGNIRILQKDSLSEDFRNTNCYLLRLQF